jgi:branched-chain amino acid transport system substrate-binding protein
MRSATVLTATLILAACSSGGDGKKSGNDGPGGLPAEVKIGVPLDLTGAASIAGVGGHELEGIKLAKDEIEKSGFLGDTKITLNVIDTKADKSAAVAAVLKLVSQDQVDALVGFSLTPSFMAAAPQAQSKGVPTVAVGLAAPGVSEVGDHVFRIVPNVSKIYPPADKNFIESFGAKRVAYLYNNDSDTVLAIQKARSDSLEKAGVKAVAIETMTQKDIDVRAQLTKIKNANPDVVIFNVFPGQVGMVSLQAREIGIKAQLIATDGSASEQTLEQAGKAMQCMVFTAVWSPLGEEGRNQQFQKDLQAKLGADTQPDLFYAAGYDGLWTYATALKNAGTADKAKVRDALAALKDFEGAMGKYSFDENREPTMGGTNIQIRDSKPQLWEPGASCS